MKEKTFQLYLLNFWSPDSLELLDLDRIPLISINDDFYNVAS
jgi:hypothetical protein